MTLETDSIFSMQKLRRSRKLFGRYVKPRFPEVVVYLSARHANLLPLQVKLLMGPGLYYPSTIEHRIISMLKFFLLTSRD